MDTTKGLANIWYDNLKKWCRKRGEFFPCRPRFHAKRANHVLIPGVTRHILITSDIKWHFRVDQSDYQL